MPMPSKYRASTTCVDLFILREKLNDIENVLVGNPAKKVQVATVVFLRVRILVVLDNYDY